MKLLIAGFGKPSGMRTVCVSITTNAVTVWAGTVVP